jgi:Nuclease-related domain
VIENDESDMMWTIGLMFAPVTIAFVALHIVTVLSNKSLTGFMIVMTVFLISIFPCVKILQKRLQRRWDHYIGFFGERYVAEWLEPLKSQGWFIFHDIQCNGATGKFNLDHVAVGPSGIWVVETKTWRKGRARPGFKDHEVIFDGTKIIWPWWDDSETIKDAINNGEWLQKSLRDLTGKTFAVSAVVAVPGYYVTEKKLGTIRVANPKNLSLVLTGRGKTVLSDSDLDLVRRQLEAKCRDVRY